MHKWVVRYDITEDKIRKKVAKTLLDYGEIVQFSVFECELVEKESKKLIDKLSNVLSFTCAWALTG